MTPTMTWSKNQQAGSTPRAIWGMLFLLAAAGCGQPQSDYLSVKGTVLVNDEPASGVLLQFHGPQGEGSAEAKKEQSAPSADGVKTDEDGSFNLRVRAPGTYIVTAVWPQVTIVEGEEVEGNDRFAGQFLIPGRTGMKITVQKGTGELPPIRFTFP
jgi:hypothetical protein